MNTLRHNPRKVKKETLIDALNKEVKFHKAGGTSYRKDTANLSLHVAKNVDDVSLFLNPRSSRQLVKNLLSAYDKYRQQDVTKMLHVTAKNLYLNHNLSDEMKAHLKRKMRTRNSKQPLLVKSRYKR
ncbi:hypothetical protein [Tenuibacillus multivorans]|uniref:Uncharacterized protein n=1 Tax=Tenuibacillus multivorans TaxID=237069 RepID=A0A1H0G7G3_9BACI|nr:hypothetical protein [Tenuibacillus multivorans]GEL78716.1 hypothetical protein TMU01_29510 [Tenuibacillus multivorans]SDO02709.1 hypothetical protein SAMN05216498_0483 [Tenuibacillus multivorans]